VLAAGVPGSPSPRLAQSMVLATVPQMCMSVLNLQPHPPSPFKFGSPIIRLRFFGRAGPSPASRGGVCLLEAIPVLVRYILPLCPVPSCRSGRSTPRCSDSESLTSPESDRGNLHASLGTAASAGTP
jgi:hypothetical protein